MKSVSVHLLDSVLEVRLERPEVRNAFSPEMIAELTSIFSVEARNPRVRWVVLRGEGNVFCAGADLQWMKDMASATQDENREDALRLYDLFEALWQVPAPVACLVQGAAMGGALGLIACSDFVLASSNTQFCFSEVKLGLVPAVISDFVLRKSPVGLAQPWMISGKVFDAPCAQRMGLVHEVVDEERWNERIPELVRELLFAGPEAARVAKELVRKVSHTPLPDRRELTAKVIAERRVSAEGQVGLQSFLNKKPVAWRPQ